MLPRNFAKSVNLRTAYIPAINVNLPIQHSAVFWRHQVSMHEGLTYACDHCEYFASRDNLRRHINTTHRSVNLLCELCDYQTGNKSSLKTHQLTHTGDKPHLCTSCPKTFSRSGSLIIHQRKRSLLNVQHVQNYLLNQHT